MGWRSRCEQRRGEHYTFDYVKQNGAGGIRSSATGISHDGVLFYLCADYNSTQQPGDDRLKSQTKADL
jgi:hypothetical protein